MTTKQAAELAHDITTYLVLAKAETLERGGRFTAGDMKIAAMSWLLESGLTIPTKDRKSRESSGTARFAHPTPDEVEAYGESIDYPLDGANFCNSYAAKGWMIGKVKMKSWRHAVANWKSNGWGKLLTQPKTETENRDYTKL